MKKFKKLESDSLRFTLTDLAVFHLFTISKLIDEYS